MTETGRFVRFACVALFAVTSVVVVGETASADAVPTIAELRSAVDVANANPGNDTIALVSGATYSISGDQCDEVATKDDDENESGDLDVLSFNETASDVQDLTIEVPSGPPAIIQVSCPLTRAIEVISPDDFSGLSADAVVQSGLVPQDAIGLGRLTLRNVVIRGGRAPHDFELFTVDSYGGGVFAFAANLTLDNVTFDDNAAADGVDGDDSAADGGGGGFGGGLAVLIGDIHVVDSTFNDNRAGHGGRGFDGFCDGGPVLPGAGGFGGSGGAIFALQVVSSFDLSIETSTFTANRAGDGGDGGDESEAAACVEGPFDGAPGGFGGSGGAIAAFLSTLSVGHSAFVANTAGDGGAGGSGNDGADALAPVLRPAAESPSAEFVAADGEDAGSGAPGGDGGDGGAIATISGTIVVVRDVAPTPDRVIVNSTFDSNVSGSGGPGGGGGNGGVGFGGGAEGAAGTAGDGGSGGFGGAISDFPVTLDGASGLAAELRSDLSPQQVEGAFDLFHDTITQNGHGGAGGPAGAPGSGSGTPAAASDGEDGGGSLDIASLEATGIVVGTSDGTGPDCWSTPL
ncbi:MAG: hypothetical protein QOG30_3431, partial [Acidimicrobiaceae bacterium]